jgi:peptide/nickel transport system permease protein
MVGTVLAISIISFIIIQAPPGDYLNTYIAQMTQLGETVSQAELDNLRERYGLGRPMHVQYLKWIQGIIKGDVGRSMYYGGELVSRIILDRLPWSLAISIVSLLFVYLLSIPIGVFSATHQYSIRDYIFTVIGFLGIAIPNFLFALILLWAYFKVSGKVAIGLFSQKYILAPWSILKLWDLIKHMWMPALVIGTAGTCGLIRIMRANLLDELQKPYVKVAQSKGISKRKLLYKYPFRIAVNPVVSTIGWTLPTLISGELLTSLVLNLPTLAPVFLQSLMSEDMFLAASIVFILSCLTVIGTFLSDILLAWLDPRIREAV